MNGLLLEIQNLQKALEAGQYSGAPGTMTQGAALQIEDLSPILHNVTFQEKHLKLQKDIAVDSCKNTLAQFDRQLDYGQFGGSAQFEGAVGQEETSSFVRITVPMCYYSHIRRTTLASNMVATVDGKKASEREAEAAAKKIAGDIEFDIFRGHADFSNSGVFDGNLAVIAPLPNMRGIDQQVRESDFLQNSHDQMFEEFGSNQSCVISGGAVLTQSNVQQAITRSTMNMGEADELFIDPLVAAAYQNSLIASGGAVGQRIMIGDSPVQATGASLNSQWTTDGQVKFQVSRFLSAKTAWARTRSTAPGAPTFTTANYGATVAGSLNNGTYRYIVTACNSAGEGTPVGLGVDTEGTSKETTDSGAGLGSVRLTITAGSGTTEWYNVYRTAAGASTAAVNYKFIGRVKSAGTTTYFVDLGNRGLGAVTGVLVQRDTMAMKELAPFSSLKLAVHDLSEPNAHFRFATLAVHEPRKNILIDNLLSTF